MLHEQEVELAEMFASLGIVSEDMHPIHFAAQRGLTKIVKVLVKADPTAVRSPAGPNRQLPLHMAVKAGHVATASFLARAFPETIDVEDATHLTPVCSIDINATNF